MKKCIRGVFIVFMLMNLFVPAFAVVSNPQIKMAPQEEKKIPISGVLQKIIREKDVKAAIEQYQYLKNNEPDKYDFSENHRKYPILMFRTPYSVQPYGKERNILPHLKNIKTAVLTVGGWFDAEDLYGPLKTYASIEKNNPGIQNNLIMGPWYHGGWGRQGPEKLGDVLVYNASAGKYFQENILLPFFKYHLKGKNELNLPEAFAYETGTNMWQLYDKWPPENVKKKGLYLHADNKLSFEEPANVDGDTFNEYTSDPFKPVPHMGKTIYRWSYDFMHADQRYAATRPDVLVFESNVLKEDVTIAGPIQAELFVSTSGTDADWVVKLIDVYPDDTPNPIPNPANVRMGGYQMLVRGEIMRGKFRNSFERPEPFVPGKVTKVEFELQDINHTFLKRHKIMVQIQSTWFPLFDRNPQKFMDIYKAGEEDFQKAVHRVYHSREFPSHLRVNVVVPREAK